MREQNKEIGNRWPLIQIGGLALMLAVASSCFAAVPLEELSLKTAAESLDLRQLKTPEKAEIGQKYITLISYEVEGKVPQAFEECVAELKRMGCAEPAETTSKMVSDGYATVTMTKDGYTFLVTALPGDKSKVGVSVRNQARFDCSTLPSLDDGHDSYIGPTFATFVTAVKVPEAIEQISERLKKEGWEEYAPAHTASLKNDEFQMRTFRRGAVDLSVNAMLAPALGNKTSIQYGVAMLLHQLPTPPDSKEVELVASKVFLQCLAPGDLASVANFYRTELPKIGYEEPKSDALSRSSERMVFRNPEKDVLFIELKSADNSTTKVKIEGYSAHSIAEMEKKREKKQ